MWVLLLALCPPAAAEPPEPAVAEPAAEAAVAPAEAAAEALRPERDGLWRSLSQGKMAEAVAQARTILADEPKDVDALVVLGIHSMLEPEAALTKEQQKTLLTGTDGVPVPIRDPLAAALALAWVLEALEADDLPAATTLAGWIPDHLGPHAEVLVVRGAIRAASGDAKGWDAVSEGLAKGRKPQTPQQVARLVRVIPGAPEALIGALEQTDDAEVLARLVYAAHESDRPCLALAERTVRLIEEDRKPWMAEVAYLCALTEDNEARATHWKAWLAERGIEPGARK